MKIVQYFNVNCTKSLFTGTYINYGYQDRFNKSDYVRWTVNGECNETKERSLADFLNVIVIVFRIDIRIDIRIELQFHLKCLSWLAVRFAMVYLMRFFNQFFVRSLDHSLNRIGKCSDFAKPKWEQKWWKLWFGWALTLITTILIT